MAAHHLSASGAPLTDPQEAAAVYNAPACIHVAYAMVVGGGANIQHACQGGQHMSVSLRRTPD